MFVSSPNVPSDLASRLANSAPDLAALSVVSTAPQGRPSTTTNIGSRSSTAHSDAEGFSAVATIT